MSTCTVYKSMGVILGTGSITNGATSVTGFTAVLAPGTLRNVQIGITSSTDAGKSFPTRVTVDGGTTLTIAHANPYAT